MTAETILNSTYLYGSRDPVLNDNQETELYHQLSDVWSKAAMSARKWLSNTTELNVLENISEKDRSKEVNLETAHLLLIKFRSPKCGTHQISVNIIEVNSFSIIFFGICSTRHYLR